MSKPQFDCAVLTVGPGAYAAAIRAAQPGLDAAYAERRETVFD